MKSLAPLGLMLLLALAPGARARADDALAPLREAFLKCAEEEGRPVSKAVLEESRSTDPETLKQAIWRCDRRKKRPAGELASSEAPSEVERVYRATKAEKDAARRAGSVMNAAPWKNREIESSGAAPAAAADGDRAIFQQAGYQAPAGYIPLEERYKSVGSAAVPGPGYLPISEHSPSFKAGLANPGQVEVLHDTEAGWNKLCAESKDCFACKAPEITRFCFADLADKDLGALRADLLEEYKNDCMKKTGRMREACNSWKHVKLFAKHGYFPGPAKGLCAVDMIIGVDHCSK